MQWVTEWVVVGTYRMEIGQPQVVISPWVQIDGERRQRFLEETVGSLPLQGNLASWGVTF